MIPLNALPQNIRLEILKKMTMQSWVRSRRTCRSLYHFILNNKGHFHFKPKFSLIIQFSCKSRVIFFGRHGIRTLHHERFMLSNVTVQTAGLVFPWIEIIGDRTNQRKCRRTFLTDIITKCRNANLRTERLRTLLHETDVMTLMTMIPPVMYAEEHNLAPFHCPGWIDRKDLRHVTEFKCSIRCLTHLTKYFERFSQFNARLYYDSKCRNLDIGVALNSLLKESARHPLTETKTLSIKCLSLFAFPRMAATECDGIPHTTLLNVTNQRMKPRMFADDREIIYKVRICLIEENGFNAITVMVFNTAFMLFYMKAWPVLIIEEVADFLLTRCVGLQPTDMSVLIDQLKTETNIAHGLTTFLRACYRI